MSGSTLAETVAIARRDRETLDAGPAADVDSIEEAYRVQEELFGERPLVGYKLGLISPAKQRQMGHSSPIYGRVAADMVHPAEVDLAEFIQPRIEPELAVVLSDPLPAGSTVGSAERAIGGAFLALDILDSIWSGYKFSLNQCVADNTSGGGFLIGDRLLDRRSGMLQLFLDGRLLGEGSLAPLDGTATNLVRLADGVGGLEAGCIVFAGSPAAAVPAEPGLLEVRGPSGSLLTRRLVATSG